MFELRVIGNRVKEKRLRAKKLWGLDPHNLKRPPEEKILNIWRESVT
jgi:hypothetical protein